MHCSNGESDRRGLRWDGGLPRFYPGSPRGRWNWPVRGKDLRIATPRLRKREVLCVSGPARADWRLRQRPPVVSENRRPQTDQFSLNVALIGL
ncbi:MAG: hypothetical protein C0485_06465 [Pirellula sp.]|nr:hypothetical protein [Pirellula sp.]